MNKRFLLLILVALIGFALSVLSLYQYVSLSLGHENPSSFCSISAHVDCAKIHTSQWSSFLGKPLASYGLGFYLLIVIISVLGLANRVMSREESRDFIFLSSFFASLASIALFYVSEVMVGALCPVCISMYLVNFVLFWVSWRMPTSEGIFSRIVAAFRAGFRLLAIWIPRTTRSSQGIISRVLTIFALCTVFGLVIGGELYMRKYLLPGEEVDPGEGKTEAEAVQEAVNEYVRVWQAQPAVTFSIVRNQVIAGDHVKGTEGSALQIIEFSDFECPHCQQLGAALARLLKEFPGVFEVVHKDFPLDSSCNKYSAGMHVGACKAAEFARCAGEQGKFWNIAEFFFSSGVPEATTEKDMQQKLLKSVNSFGLDEDAMRECLDSGRQLEKIKRDTDLGEVLQLQGTPSVWINGKALQTPHPDVVRAIIEDAAQRLKK